MLVGLLLKENEEGGAACRWRRLFPAGSAIWLATWSPHHDIPRPMRALGLLPGRDREDSEDVRLHFTPSLWFRTCPVRESSLLRGGGPCVLSEVLPRNPGSQASPREVAKGPTELPPDLLGLCPLVPGARSPDDSRTVDLASENPLPHEEGLWPPPWRKAVL